MIIEINEYLKTVKNQKIVMVSNMNKFIHKDLNDNVVGFINVDQRNKSHDSFYLGQNMAKHGLIDIMIIDHRKENLLDENLVMERYGKDLKIKESYETYYLVDTLDKNSFYIEIKE